MIMEGLARYLVGDPTRARPNEFMTMSSTIGVVLLWQLMALESLTSGFRRCKESRRRSANVGRYSWGHVVDKF